MRGGRLEEGVRTGVGFWLTEPSKMDHRGEWSGQSSSRKVDLGLFNGAAALFFLRLDFLLLSANTASRQSVVCATEWAVQFVGS